MKAIEAYSQVSKGVRLTDKDFVAKGGEASVYRQGSWAFKIYHKAKTCIPEKKVTELAAISDDHLLVPLSIVYNKQKCPIGYVMRFVVDGQPLCRLFTKAFKNANGITPQSMSDLVEKIQTTVQAVHNGKCLIVDFNEFNLMVESDLITPVFLDVDSYQTPSFRATALMESVRDPKVANNQFTELSDWYSWGIVTCQLYIGVHPFKGGHPQYKKNDWRKRMDDGVSIFHKDARVPPSCSSFSIIPKRQLEWMKEVFENGDRSVPPLPGDSGPVDVSSRAARVLRVGDGFTVDQVWTVDGHASFLSTDLGSTYLATSDYIWRNGQKWKPRNVMKTFVCSQDGRFIVAEYDGKTVSFDYNNEKTSFSADGGFCSGGRLYALIGDRIFETEFVFVGDRLIANRRLIATVVPNQTKLYEGVAIQRSIDRTIAILPYERQKSIIRTIPELDDYRILNARAEGHILVVIGEKDGMYHRIVVSFDHNHTKYDVRITEDVSGPQINFAVLPNGVCVLATNGEVEIFKDAKTIKVADNPPFDESTPLFATEDGIHFIDDDTVYKVTLNGGKK